MLRLFFPPLKDVPRFLILTLEFFFCRLQHQTADHSSFGIGRAFSKVNAGSTGEGGLNSIFPGVAVGANVAQRLASRTDITILLGIVDELVFAEGPCWFFERLPL